MPKQTLVEGQTATNPQTGERIVYRGGKWYPHDANAPAPMPKLTNQEAIALKEARDSAQMFSDVTDQANRFIELNRKAATGPLYGIPGVKTAMGILNPAVSQMNALAARMAPQQRVPGSGTTSDRDLALFLQAIPSTDRMGTANQAIAGDMQAMTEKRQARSAFFESYAQKRGTLNGAQVAFDQWWRQYDGQRKQKASGGAGGYKILSVE